MCRRRGASPAAAGPIRSAGSAAGVEGTGGSEGAGRSAGGRRQGLAGLRDDAPSRRLAARTASGRAAAQQHTQRPERASAALEAPPVCRVPEGLAGLRADAPSISSTASAAGVEGTGGSEGPGRSAGGRRQGLAGLRDDAPSRRLAARTASGRATAHRHTQRLSPESGASGARNVSGPTRNAGNPATNSTGARTRRPAPLDATTQTQLRSTCVRCRSAHAAHRSRRSSRSPRLQRRAGPRR